MSTMSTPLTTLRVAVSGHRDIDPGHEAALRSAVHEVISGLVERCRPARVELLTGMADGADQLASEVAAALDCDLHLVLPKPPDTYRCC